MIDINYVDNQPQPRPEHQQQTTLPLENGRTIADIMADVLLRKQQRQQLQHRASSSHLGGDEGAGEEETSRRRVRSSSPTSSAAEQSLQSSETSIVTTTRRRHRPRASIIVTTLFSIFYFISLFTSKLDIVLPSYIKSASESVHQLYGTAEAQSYLDYFEELAHPTIYFVQYIMSRAASDMGDMSGVVGGRPQPPLPPTSVHPSPTSPPQRLGPLDLLKKYDIVRSFSEYSWFEEPELPPDWNLEDIILRYFRACPLHQNDSKTGYIVLTEKEYNHLYDNDEIKLTNVDIAMQHGYPNLYQHIHLHQQATDAINFKITSCVLVGSNDKVDINWKKEYLGQNLYLLAILIKVDEPRTRAILRPHRRDSSQHQEFELNQPTSTPPLQIQSVGQQLVVLRGPTAQYIFVKIDHPAIISSHVFDQTLIQDLSTPTHVRSSVCARAMQTGARHKGTSPHPHVFSSHKEHREVAGRGYIDIKDIGKVISYIEHVYADYQHHALQRSYDHHQLQ